MEFMKVESHSDKYKNEQLAYHYEKTYDTAGNGEWIIAPTDVSKITITLSGGTAKMQTTTSSINNLNNAVAIDWGHGEVSTPTQDAIIAPITAFRVVVSTPTVNFTAVAYKEKK